MYKTDFKSVYSNNSEIRNLHNNSMFYCCWFLCSLMLLFLLLTTFHTKISWNPLLFFNSCHFLHKIQVFCPHLMLQVASKHRITCTVRWELACAKYHKIFCSFTNHTIPICIPLHTEVGREHGSSDGRTLAFSSGGHGFDSWCGCLTLYGLGQYCYSVTYRDRRHAIPALPLYGRIHKTNRQRSRACTRVGLATDDGFLEINDFIIFIPCAYHQSNRYFNN